MRERKHRRPPSPPRQPSPPRSPAPRPPARAAHDTDRETDGRPPAAGTPTPRRSRRRPPRSERPGDGQWLWGRHAVLAAVANPARRLRRLACLPEAAAELDAAIAAAGAARPNPEPLDRRGLDALLPPGAVHQGLAALAQPLAEPVLEDVIDAAPGPDTLLLVLDQATDPRNVGAVLRAAAAFGAAGVVVQDRHAPHETGALAKAASGALETVPLVRVVNVARCLRMLADEGFRGIGLAADAASTLAEAEPFGRTALVLGSEGAGLRRLVREACAVVVRIPITAGVDSLNVAAAAAIALYECRRGLPRSAPTGDPG